MPALLIALAEVKRAAAQANFAIGELDADRAMAIVQACDEIIAGSWHGEFVVDVLQGGAGTSTNMNMNEVVANRALMLLGHEHGQYDRLNPNDHVNRSQSTNDAYATAVRLSVYSKNRRLVQALADLENAFRSKAEEFGTIPKLGRTQLQDAVPMTLGQEFDAFAATIGEDRLRADEIGDLFLEVNLGGTAIGTGIGANPAYSERVLDCLRNSTGLKIVQASNLFEATWDMGAFVLYSGLLKRIAVKISKIASDLRLLASGPRGGLGEIKLPDRQPGSSLMPGKVNPVIPEAINQVAYRVFGADTTITFAADAGQLQLNAFEPIIAWSLHEAIDLLTAGMDVLANNCVSDISANPEACQDNLVRSTALATALVPQIGYMRAAELAKTALRDGIDLESAVAKLEPSSLPLLHRALSPR